jgi:hypothetical protein
MGCGDAGKEMRMVVAMARDGSEEGGWFLMWRV